MTMAVDGSATGQGSSGASFSATLTTASTNDIIVAIVSAENRPNSSLPTLNSLTASGLTFTRRSQFTTTSDLLEVWWAYSSAPLSSEVITAAVSNYDDGALAVFGVSGTNYLGSGNPWNTASAPSVNTGAGSVVLTTDGWQPHPFVIAAWSDSSPVSPSGTQPSWLTGLTSVPNGGGTDWEYLFVASGVPTGALSGTTVGWSSSAGSPLPLMMADALLGVSLVDGFKRQDRLFRNAPGLRPPFGNPRPLMGITEPYPLLVKGASAFVQGLVRSIPDVSVQAKPGAEAGYSRPEVLYSIYPTPPFGQEFAFARQTIRVQGVPAFECGVGTVPGKYLRALPALVSGFSFPAHTPFWKVSSVAASGSGFSTPAGSLFRASRAFGKGFSYPAALNLYPPTGISGGGGGGGGVVPQNGGGTIKLGSWRWQLVDPASLLSTYNWDINPNQGTFPTFERQINKTPTTAPDGPVLMFEGRQIVPMATIQGTFNSQNQFTQLAQWFNLRRPFYVVDDLANRWTVYITNFQPGRKLSRMYPWKAEYTLEWIVLDVLYSNNPGPGFSAGGLG